MSEKTTIEWTESTWNPVTGCAKVSAGCLHCYAEAFAERFRGVQGHPYEQGFDVKLWPERLDLPLKWKAPRSIFVNSMSDLFHADVPDDFIRRVFETMNHAERHIFQVLTKRPQRAVQLSPFLTWTGNIWMGVTVERQEYVPRLDFLVGIPAAVRFVSCEPLIGPVKLKMGGLDWVIVGGSRPNMRGEWTPNGFEEYASSVRPQTFLSSSSSGATLMKRAGGLGNRRPAGFLMAERGMGFLSG